MNNQANQASPTHTECTAACFMWFDTLSPEERAYLWDMVRGMSTVELCALAGVGELEISSVENGGV